jgi:hypothetical protein
MRTRRDGRDEHAEGVRARPASQAEAASRCHEQPPASRVLHLQRLAGNSAVTRAMMAAARPRHHAQAGEAGAASAQRRPVHDVPASPGRAAGADPPQAVHGESGLRRLAETAAGTTQSGPSTRRSAGDPRVGEPGPGATQPAVQRKVGFEFESKWSPWRHLRTTSAEGSDRSVPEPPTAPDGALAGDQVEPVARKVVLESGAGFTLEADDTPGPTRSNLEFVSAPFDETPAGLDEFEIAVDNMRTIALRIDRYSGLPGPDITRNGPPYPVPADSLPLDFVLPAEHGLGGSAQIPGKDVLLSGGDDGFPVKMQSTAGLPLADLPEMLVRLGRPVPRETNAQAESRRRDRATMHPVDRPPEIAHQIMGHAPHMADLLINSMRRHPGYSEGLSGDTRELSGFIAAVVMVTAFLQEPVPRSAGAPLIKDRLPLMPRNNFRQMFEALPENHQALLATNPDALVGLLLQILKYGFQRDFPATTPLIPPTNPDGAPERALATVTIGEWIRGVLTGEDYLAQRGMERWLSGKGHFSATTKSSAVEGLESIGTYPTGDRRADTGKELFKFENRAINPIYAGEQPLGLPLSQALENAIEIFRMFVEIRYRDQAQAQHEDSRGSAGPSRHSGAVPATHSVQGSAGGAP